VRIVSVCVVLCEPKKKGETLAHSGSNAMSLKIMYPSMGMFESMSYFLAYHFLAQIAQKEAKHVSYFRAICN
jgi:hypothetical protein